MGTTATTTILRFRRSERFLHWAIAIPFLGCISSALFLLLLNEGESSGLLREMVSTGHKVFGVSLILSPLIVLFCHIHDLLLHVKNVKEVWIWNIDDIKWIVLMPLSILSKKIALPREGKFNAGEKINFMMTMTAYFAFALTGFFILYERDVFLSSSIHFFITTLTIPIIAGHIFMATINPETRKGLTGMVTGFVDKEWASHHYRRWFCEEFTQKTKTPETSGEDDAKVEQPPVRKSTSITETLLNMLSALLVGALFTGILVSATFVYVSWLAPYVIR